MAIEGNPWNYTPAAKFEVTGMHTDEITTLKTAAMKLPEQERAKRASDLVTSLDGSGDTQVAEAWDREICRRINEIEAGTVQLLDVDEVLIRAKARNTQRV